MSEFIEEIRNIQILLDGVYTDYISGIDMSEGITKSRLVKMRMAINNMLEEINAGRAEVKIQKIMTVKCDEDIRNKIKTMSRLEPTTISKLVNGILKEYVEMYEELHGEIRIQEDFVI